MRNDAAGTSILVDDVAERARAEKLMKSPASVFVFGSNEIGVHGAGAARTAFDEYGAEWGVGEGLTGRGYALPTKDAHIRSLPLGAVADRVQRFLAFAESHPDVTFVVTRIGCGYAGFTDAQIAPLFRGAPANCELPIGWREFAQ